MDTATLKVRVRRQSDQKREQLTIDSSTFLAEYGYNVWVHFVMTHKMHGTGTNINVYLNGTARHDSVKDTPNGANHQGVNGHMDIGTSKVGSQSYIGNFMMDELIIYEYEMTPGDVWQLYNIYT